MALREGQFGELKVPLAWTAAVALAVAAIVAAALFFADRRAVLRDQAYGVARQGFDTVATPVGGVVSAPGRWAGGGVAFVRSYLFAASENRRLTAELAEMRQWRDVALAQESANNRYKALLGLKTDPPIPMVAARAVTESRGPFANTRLIDTGEEAGVVIGNPVMNERGLVGRVIGVAPGASRVLLLTDIASRVPVMIDRTQARAVLTGDGSPSPRMEYLRGRDPIKAGDRIVTSGEGGVLPRGLPVGAAVKSGAGWRAVLFADTASIDFVRILKFKDFTQLVDRKALERPGLPPVTTDDPDAAPIVLAAPTAPTPATAPKPAAPAAKPSTSTAAKPTAPAAAAPVQ